MTSERAIRQLVDRLGEVKAAIAGLKTEEDRLVLKLKENGLGVYSGTLFDANVYDSTREMVDWKAIAETVGFTTRLKNKYTKAQTIIYCKVTARLSRAVANS